MMKLTVALLALMVFTADAVGDSDAEKRFYIHIEGAPTDARFFINGKVVKPAVSRSGNHQYHSIQSPVLEPNVPYAAFISVLDKQADGQGKTTPVMRDWLLYAFTGEIRTVRFSKFYSVPVTRRKTDCSGLAFVDLFGFPEFAEYVVDGNPVARSQGAHLDFYGRKGRRLEFATEEGGEYSRRLAVKFYDEQGKVQLSRAYLYYWDRTWWELEAKDFYDQAYLLSKEPQRQTEVPDSGVFDLVDLPSDAKVSFDGKEVQGTVITKEGRPQRRGLRFEFPASKSARTPTIIEISYREGASRRFLRRLAFYSPGDRYLLSTNDFLGNENWISAPKFSFNDSTPPLKPPVTEPPVNPPPVKPPVEPPPVVTPPEPPPVVDPPNTEPGIPGLGTLELYVPVGAEVILNGKIAPSSENEIRSFNSPLLQTGDVYPMHVKVQYRDAKTAETVVFEQDVHLHPGRKLKLDARRRSTEQK